MPEIRTNLYEGMFLLNQQAMASDSAGTLDHVRQILLKAKAELIAFRKWDERRLAYEVKGEKRGTYVLAHFKAQSDRLKEIDRDCNLSDVVMRSMIIKGDHIGDIELQQLIDDAATGADQEKLQEGGDGGSAEAVGSGSTEASVASESSPSESAPAVESGGEAVVKVAPDPDPAPAKA